MHNQEHGCSSKVNILNLGGRGGGALNHHFQWPVDSARFDDHKKQSLFHRILSNARLSPKESSFRNQIIVLGFRFGFAFIILSCCRPVYFVDQKLATMFHCTSHNACNIRVTVRGWSLVPLRKCILRKVELSPKGVLLWDIKLRRQN